MSDLDKLIRFSVVAEELSFSQAARRLHVDQPWLSRQIQQLETQMGLALFVRSTRRVALTPEGEELFAEAKELARVAEQCRQVSRGLMSSRSVRLTIGANPYTYWVPARKNLIDAFQASHKRVTIDIVSNYTSRLISKLRKRLIDVALVAGPFDYADLETLVIHDSPYSLLVPPEHDLAQRGRVPLSALAGIEVPTVSDRLNPAHWELVFQPFIDAGMVPFTVPEGEVAIPFYARDRRMPVLSAGWPHSDHGALTDFVHVEIEDSPARCRFALVRRSEPPRGLLTHFWNTALQLSGIEPVVEPAEAPVRTPAAKRPVAA